ncbi:MAG: MFS transporter [Chloroflexi bacterium]|nr:MFS transporter [Chloroflexota bacterium]
METSLVKAQSRFGLWIVYAIVFISFLDYQSSLPIISPYAKSLGASIALVGVIVGAYSALNLIGNLGAGYWIDRAGRKLPLVMGLTVVGIALLFYPIVRDAYTLLALRAIHGLGAALISPASLAYIGDAAAQGGRGRAMALYGSAIGLTSVLGPPFAGAIRDRFGYGAVFIILAAMMFVIAVCAMLLLGESSQRENQSSANPLRLLRNRRLVMAYTSAFCLLFSLGTLIVFLPLIGQTMNVTSARVGFWFASFGVAAVFIQLALGRLSDRIGREPVMGMGLALIAIALFVLPMTPDWETTITIMALYGFGFGMLFPAMTALLADETDVSSRGTASGIYTAVYSLGAALGTGSAGVLVWLQQSAQIHPFQVAAGIVMLGLAWVIAGGWYSTRIGFRENAKTK